MTTLAPEETPTLRAVLFPARVTLPDGSKVRTAKVIVTLARVYVFVGGATGISERYSAEYGIAEVPSDLAPRSDPWIIETADGELRAVRLPGCGCGTALKRYQPFVPERWAAQ